MQPVVKPLSLWRRKLVFGALMTAFLISLPVFIFYARGYRYNFTPDSAVFTATGGFYILADAADSEIFIDDTLVTNARTFRNASYIQGLKPGLHRVYVQSPGLHTWVKELEVYPHIVTEADSFNLPVIPQIRLVTEYDNNKGLPVVFAAASTSPVLTGPASTSLFTVTTSTATTTFSLNQEFVFLSNLFQEKASTTAFLENNKKLSVPDKFKFSTSTGETKIEELATSTVTKDNLKLFERSGDVFAGLVKVDKELTPYYFCAGLSTIEEVMIDTVSTTTMPLKNLDVAKATCREEIKIDRKGEAVLAFDFYPSDSNLIIMQLESGIYVVEADDRSWQNTQLLYPGVDLEFIIYRGGIFIKQGTLIFEVLPEVTI